MIVPFLVVNVIETRREVRGALAFGAALALTKAVDRAGRRRLGRRSGRRGRDDHLLRADRELADAAGHPRGRRRVHAAGAAAGVGAGQPAAAGAGADPVVPALVLDRRRARDPAGRAARRAHARPAHRGDRRPAAGRGGLDALAAAAPGRFAGRQARRLARADQGRGERPGPLPVRRAAQRDRRDPAPGRSPAWGWAGSGARPTRSASSTRTGAATRTSSSSGGG